MVKRLLSLCWLLLQVLFMSGCGYAALGLAAFWSIGFWLRLNHELSWEGLEFVEISALLWFMVIGYVVAVRTWWPYAKRELWAVMKPTTHSPRLPGQ
jgi:hypothetical protein